MSEPAPQRVFVAVGIPGPVRARLDEAQAALRTLGPAVRPVAPGNLHLTLRFLGELAPARVQEVRAALREARWPARFELYHRGLGAFPARGRPRVLWSGCEGVGLAALRDAVEDSLAGAGVPRDVRAFTPHVTLARVRGEVRPDALAKLLEGRGGDEFGAHPVAEVRLLESRLGHGGAVYSTLEEFPLL